MALQDPEALYDDLLPTLRESDLRIVNLEGPLSTRGEPIPKNGPNIRLPPACVAALAAVPFDLACLANNHVMDYGPEGLRETLEILGENGVRHVGAGLTEEQAHAPAMLDVRGLRLAVVNFCEGEDGTAAAAGAGTFGWEPDRVVRAVADARGAADVVMVVVHAGREYVPVPPPYIQRVYRSIAEAGADIVVGHHPHVPQGIEIHEGVPIVYSLGNFVLGQRSPVLRRFGLVLSVELGNSGVSGFRLEPCLIDETGVHRPPAAQREWLLHQLRMASDVLGDPDRVRDTWHAFIDGFGEGFWRGRVRPSIRGFVSARLHRSPGSRDFGRYAANLRNQYVTPAHQHFMADGLARLLAGDLGSSPPWARSLVERWLSLEGLDPDQSTSS